MGLSVNCAQKDGPLAILSANIRGLSPRNGKFKIPLLLEKAISENIGIITLTESHLNEGFSEGEIHMAGFQHYRADRKQGTLKGGIITYVRDDLLPGLKEKMAGSIGCIEYQVICIEKIDLTLVTIYRPPTAKSDDFRQVIQEIKAIIQNINPEPRLAVTGDLNFPTLNWDLQTIGACSSETRLQAQTLLDFFEDNFLEQYVEEATRANNILDIFATNDSEIVLSTSVENVDRRTSDHKILLIKTRITLNSGIKSSSLKPPNVLDTLNFWSPNIDWPAIKGELSTCNWAEVLNSPDVDDIAATMLKQIEKTCLKFVPPKVDKKRSIIPRDRRILMGKRKNLRTKLLGTRDPRTLSSIENSLEEIDRKLVDSHEAQLIQDELRATEKIKDNSKFFYNYARSKSKIRSPVGPLIKNNRTVSDPQEISEIMKAQFESVFNLQTVPANVEEIMKDYGCRGLEDIVFTEADIESSIKEIPKNSSPGPDGVSAILLRECADVLKVPIYILWRASLDSGKLPKYMKSSIVTPVFKGGDRSQAENYRPISLISHLCKLFERIIVKKLTAYLGEADLYNTGQHGFRKGRSCLSQLIEHHQKVLTALEQHEGVDVVYLDFAKAFDKVDYDILLRKLKSIGVCGKLLRWLGDFLIGRKQSIKVSGHLSTEGNVNSGVPQGSSLGPLLFLIMVSDININAEHVAVSSFADDTRFLKSIIDNSECSKMQDDLIGVYRWATENNMRFNSKKFELLSYSASKRDLNEFSEFDKLYNYPQYFDPDGNLISSVGTVKDLGIRICGDATFTAQIQESVRKGSRMAGWILRVFRTRSPDVLLTLFKSMVLPQLEYCCPLWSPSASGTIADLEAVQRSFTAKMSGLADLDYWARLKKLSIYSIERRRERYLIIYTYKIIKGIVPNLSGDKYKLRTETSDRRGRSCVIPRLNPQASARVRKLIETSFPINGPNLFNSLPKKIRNSDASVDAFKASLDNFLKCVPDQPCMPGYHQTTRSNSIIKQIDALKAAGIFFN